MSTPSYDFDTVLLSAVKSGNPPMTNTTTESAGVSVLSLSPAGIGLTFNAKTDLSGLYNTVTIVNTGNSFKIDKKYNGEQFAVINKNSDNTTTYTNFRFMSASSAAVSIVLNDCQTFDNITSPETRRKWEMGYI